MITFHDVKVGDVTLAEIVRINHYLDMIADVKYFAEQDELNKIKRR